jgi:hypothetical protein
MISDAIDGSALANSPCSAVEPANSAFQPSGVAATVLAGSWRVAGAAATVPVCVSTSAIPCATEARSARSAPRMRPAAMSGVTLGSAFMSDTSFSWPGSAFASIPRMRVRSAVAPSVRADACSSVQSAG